MRRLLTTVLLILPILLLATACPKPIEPEIPTSEPYVEQFELSVDPIPAEIDTNVPKISGTVSDPGAAVYVNDSRAMVSENGTFFAYIEIPPRELSEIEIKAQSSTQEASASFSTIFYPKPSLWVSQIDTHPDPAIMEGWVSYPDAQIEITGDVTDPAVEIKKDGFFTATFILSEGYVRPGENITRYDIEAQAITPRGATNVRGFHGVTMNSIHPAFYLNDATPSVKRISMEKGETVFVDMLYYYSVPSPTTLTLEIVPDPKKGAVSENLSVSIEPRSFLAYPVTPRNCTVIIIAGEEVLSGSYFFRAIGSVIEVVVE